MSIYDPKFSSYECKYVQNVVSERDCQACLEPYLIDHITDTTLIQKKDISQSGAVVQYVERSYKTYSFRVMRVGTHKMAYGKETKIRVEAITHRSQLAYSFKAGKEISDSRVVVQYSDRLYTPYSF